MLCVSIKKSFHMTVRKIRQKQLSVSILFYFFKKRKKIPHFYWSFSSGMMAVKGLKALIHEPCRPSVQGRLFQQHAVAPVHVKGTGCHTILTKLTG